MGPEPSENNWICFLPFFSSSLLFPSVVHSYLPSVPPLHPAKVTPLFLLILISFLSQRTLPTVSPVIVASRSSVEPHDRWEFGPIPPDCWGKGQQASVYISLFVLLLPSHVLPLRSHVPMFWMQKKTNLKTPAAHFTITSEESLDCSLPPDTSPASWTRQLDWLATAVNDWLTIAYWRL